MPAWNPSAVWADGAVISTLGDLDTWAEALATGQLLSQAMHEAQLTFVPGEGYGLGVADYGNGFVGHPGEVPGFQAQMLCRTMLEGKAETLVVLCNLDIAPDGSGPADDLEGIVYQKLFAGQTRLGQTSPRPW